MWKTSISRNDDAATFNKPHKAVVRDTQFPIDLEKAYESGKRL